MARGLLCIKYINSVFVMHCSNLLNHTFSRFVILFLYLYFVKLDKYLLQSLLTLMG